MNNLTDNMQNVNDEILINCILDCAFVEQSHLPEK